MMPIVTDRPAVLILAVLLFCSQELNGGSPNPETCGSSIRFEAHGPHFNTGNAQRKYDQHAPPIHCGSK
jgi:hypothetical protein